MGNPLKVTAKEQIKKNLNKACYGWSKWGGPLLGLVQEDLTKEWICQACGEKQTDKLSPYMYEYPQGEYIRICSKCHYIRQKEHVEPCQFALLLYIVRKTYRIS